MSSRGKLRNAIILVVACALAVVTTGTAAPSTSSPSPMVKIIVEGTSVEDAAKAVYANGGQVTAEVNIINAVIAQAPQDRLTMTARPQFSEYSGEAAYSVWEQGAGRVWAPDAVFADIEGEANWGMDLDADLSGEEHYEGWTTYDPESGEFKIREDGFNSWAGGFNSWAGGFHSWSGGYDSWAGGTTNWSGDYNSWIEAFNSWAGGFNSWAGSYGSWAGGYSAWASGFNSWAGGFNSWAGNVGDPEWAAAFANLENVPSGTSAVGINNWISEN